MNFKKKVLLCFFILITINLQASDFFDQCDKFNKRNSTSLELKSERLNSVLNNIVNIIDQYPELNNYRKIKNNLSYAECGLGAKALYVVVHFNSPDWRHANGEIEHLTNVGKVIEIIVRKIVYPSFGIQEAEIVFLERENSTSSIEKCIVRMKNGSLHFEDAYFNKKK